MVESKLLLPAHQEYADISAWQVLIGPLTTLLHFYLICLSNRRSYGQTELFEKLPRHPPNISQFGRADRKGKGCLLLQRNLIYYTI